MQKSLQIVCLLILLMFTITACVREQARQVIVITATFLPPTPIPNSPLQPTATAQQVVSTVVPLHLSSVPDTPPSNPTFDPTRPVQLAPKASEHIVQPGDTLFGIAAQYNISMDSLIIANPDINPNILSVGQVIALPDQPTQETPLFKILPDSRLVRGPGSNRFDIAGFIGQQPGFIRTATDVVGTNQDAGNAVQETLTAAQVVDRVAAEYSVDPRLLLTLLEYRAGWLSTAILPEDLQTHPLISAIDSEGVVRSGLYRQLSWAANELNRGYYDWRYRGQTVLEFIDGQRLNYANGLNAGTVGVQYFLSLNTPFNIWQQQVLQQGFYSVYFAYFGDPFAGAIDPLVPASLQQPPLELPISQGETWYYTGGPHGGWGIGSAWSAIDLAPPDERPDGSALCYVSEHWATAVAPGIIARSDKGMVILDLDSDGDETTGWTIIYLHISSQERIPAGTRVLTEDRIGRPSCEGGFSSATHIHLARRYNGEWIPADCQSCTVDQPRPPFLMSGWQVIGLTDQHYQGFIERDGVQLVAEQGRDTPINYISR